MLNSARRIRLIFLCLAVPAFAWGAPLTIEEIVTMNRVTSAQLSPDGTQIAYLLQVPRQPYVADDGPPYRELHVTDLQGNSRGYVTGEVDVRAVDWAADGSKLYYLARREADQRVALYEIAIDGGESRKRYQHSADIEAFAPAPDGARLAFLATGAPPNEQEELQTKGFSAVAYEESLQPVDLWVLDLQSENGEAQAAELPGSASAIVWSPDGRHYAVALAPTPHIDDFYMRRDVHIVEAESGRVLGAVGHEGKLGGIAWSPDGARLAYIGAEDLHDPLEGRVYVTGLNGGRSNLTPDYLGHVHDIAWRDEDTLWFRGSRGVWTEISTLDVHGETELEPIREGEPIARSLDTRPGVEAIALVGETPEHPPEVYVWHAESGYRRLTGSNPWLAERELARQEVRRYQARDGLEIEGILLLPIGGAAGERHPLLIAVHGGPESHYSHGWMSGYTFPAQAMAAEGYAVFYPNYRASSGRGVEFSKLNHGDPAGGEFDDLVDAKEYLVQDGLVDPERVGISGGSYGGYATMWGATALTEHFAAGVAFVGVSDLLSKVGTSDIPNELYLVHLRQWPWDDWQFALERSPVYHAAQSRTPLLILTGDRDPRVHPSQSLALYRHMKLRTDTPVRLIYYPGEQHGNRNTAAQLDYALRMTRWMNHYLLGPGGEPPPYELDHASRLAAQDNAEEAG